MSVGDRGYRCCHSGYRAGHSAEEIVMLSRLPQKERVRVSE